jgi:hypothetical protein
MNKPLFATYTIIGNDLASSAEARAYYTNRQPAPIRRALKLDPTKLAEARESVRFITEKFKAAKATPATLKSRI